MPVLKFLPPAVVLIVGGIVSVLIARMREAPPKVEVALVAPLVTTAVVRSSESDMRITVDGEIVPIREITLSAEIAGRIEAKTAACDSGSFVRQGELLLAIDSRDYQLELRRLQQTVKQAEVSIEETDVERDNTVALVRLAESDLQLQRNNVARFDELIARRAVSEGERDVARRQEIQAQNALQTLQNQLRLLETRRNRLVQDKDRALTSLEQAALNLSRTQITSPLSGMVVVDLVEKDDYVSPGTPLVRLEDTSQAEVRFNLRMDQLRWLWPPAKAESANDSATAPLANSASYELPKIPLTVTIDLDGIRYQWDGYLSRYEGSGINVATRTVPCIAIVDQPSSGRLVSSTGSGYLPGPPALMRGMYVSVTIEVPHQMDILEFPASALRPGGTVWVADGDTLATRQVKVLAANDTSVRVIADGAQLNVGQLLITSPLPMAVDGMQIRTEPDVIRSSNPDSRGGAPVNAAP